MRPAKVISLARIIARAFAAIRHEETSIDPDENVEVDDNKLDSEVEDVEAGFRLVARWVGPRSHTTCEACARAEGCPEAEQNRGGEHDDNFVPESPLTKFFDSGLPRYDESANDDRDREEGDDSEEGLAVELDVAVNSSGVVV